jgi:hypothetical protein
MGNGFTWLGVMTLAIACGGKAERSEHQLDGNPPGSDDDTSSSAGSGSGGSSGTSTPVASAGSAGVVDLALCPAATFANPNERLPTTPQPPSDGMSTVQAVSANGLDLVTEVGASHFAWAGPSLDGLFAPSEVVEIGSYQEWGQDWHILSSSSVRVATLGGSWSVPLSFERGGQSGLAVPPGFPAFAFVNSGCCQNLADRDVCDYSLLRVALGDQVRLIAAGETGTVAGWTVTNLGATYRSYIFSAAVTVIGPAD